MTASNRCKRSNAHGSSQPIFGPTMFVVTPALVALIFYSGFSGTARAQQAPPKTQNKLKQITVPPGFTIERVAGPELIEHPVMAGFDDRGRLFVAANAGVNLKKAELEKQKPNFIKMLEDTNGDGVFDKATVFADKMTFPQGALWHQGALYVASPPGIWRLEDTDGDGVADKRKMIVGGFEYTGNAADVHGPFLHPGGRLYWCHGRKGHEVKQADGTLVSKGKGARIWSCKPDGSDIQVHAGGGMDNPTELCFTREGEILGTVPLLYANPRRDALVHWVYGGVYPREEQQAVIEEFKWTGGLLGHIIDLGHVAPSGVMRYRSEHFGKEYTDNIFLCEFNTHRVMRVVLERQGSTYTGKAEPFITSSNPDAHFTDVLEDADGSLLVIDTGGWFRIGCPTSKTAKPNIKGAIYRIRRKGGKKYVDPRGKKIDWENVKRKPGIAVPLLTDERFAVRDCAIAQITEIQNRLYDDYLKVRDDVGRERAASKRAWGMSALVGIKVLDMFDKGSPIDRQRLVWAQTRLGLSLDYRFGSDEKVLSNQMAIKTITARASALGHHFVWNPGPEIESLHKLAGLLQTGTPPVRLAVAEAFTQLDEKNVAPLLQSLALSDTDRPLEHALIYALIRIDDLEATAKGLADASPRVRRGALIALDQMDSGKLSAKQVAAQLKDADPALRQAAIAIITRHGWADAIQSQLGDWLKPDRWNPAQAETVGGVLGAFIEKPKVQQLLGHALGDSDAPAGLRITLLDVIASSGIKTAPDSWIAPLAKSLHVGDADTLISASRAIASLNAQGDQFKQIDTRLNAIAGNKDQSDAVRLASLSALIGRAGRAESLPDPLFKFLIARLADKDAPLQNMEAARILSAAKLNQTQLLGLTGPVKDASALTLPILIGAFAQSEIPSTGQALIDALKQSASKSALRPDQITAALKRYPQGIQEQGSALVASAKAPTEQQQALLAQLQKSLSSGDAANGKRIFTSARTSCVICHRIGAKGGQVGPDLTRIGRIRQPRDLLEAIVLPSASIARGYETYAVTTDEGLQHVGVMRRESAQALYLANAAQSNIRINRKQIIRIQATAFSIMPQGFEKALSPREMADLVAYLMQQK